MKDLLALPTTMSSRDIATLLDVRHDNVKRTIERLTEKTIISFTPVEETSHEGSGSRPVEVYQVNERDSYIVVAQLSPEFTAKLVDYWQQTKGLKLNNPQNTLMDSARNTFDNALHFAKLFNLEGNQALLAADKATARHTGFSPMRFMQIELVKEEQCLNLTATEIGKELTPALSAIATNKLLDALGFQEKLGAAWSPTEKGKPFAIFLDTGKKHSDGTPITQLKWLSSIIKHLT